MDTTAAEETVETVQTYVSLFASLDVQTILIALGGLILGFVLVRLILHLQKKALAHSRYLPPSTHSIIRSLTRIGLDFLVIVTVANYVGIPISTFVALLSVIGIAISLAVQGLLSNLVGGFLLLGAKPFEVGHFIETGGITGTVREIRMIYTRLEAPDGRFIYLPNSSLFTSQVVNYTQLGKRRITLTVSASYDNSPQQVREAISLALSRMEGVYEEPAPVIQLEAYGDSAITYNIHFWCEGGNFLTLKYAMNEELYSAFHEKGVQMTYPHLNVHMA